MVLLTADDVLRLRAKADELAAMRARNPPKPGERPRFAVVEVGEYERIVATLESFLGPHKVT